MTFEKEKIWKLPKDNAVKISEISKSLSLNPKIISALINRNIDTAEKAADFLYGGIESLHNPFLFADMQKAVERIRKAVDLREQILVYGDRDVDGVTAVNVIVNIIRLSGGNVHWYVPADEGYGIHKDILTKYAAENVKLLITVDCGISAAVEIEYAKNLGMDVIVTDHHEPPYEGIPAAYAVINPKIYDYKYPFKDLAGCSVALKTAQGLMLTFTRSYNKDILVCFAVKSGDDFSGVYLCVKNDLEIQRIAFNSVSEIKQIVKSSFRIYTNSSAIKDFFVKSDALLKDKIEVVLAYGNALSDGEIKDVNALFQAYKINKVKNDGQLKDFFDNNLDLCALGTIADSMPLVDENRIIVKEGIKLIISNPNAKPGLGLIIDDAINLKNINSITARVISWNITPVLNSSGRMGRGTLSAQLLMTNDAFQAKNLYADIIKLNADRRWLQYENIEQFKVLLKEQCDLEKDKVFVVNASNLEHGVTGIVASQMVKAYFKPVFLLITDGNEATGAARSVEGFDIIAALESVKDILVKYGGHSQAAGFTIEHSKINEFKKRISDYAEKNYTPSDSGESIVIDGELKISDINADFCRQIDIMEPFGMANPRPVFCMKGINVTEMSVFGNRGEHLKFKISQKGSRNVQAVFWNGEHFSDMLRSEDLLDIAFQLELAGKNEKEFVQLNIVDVKPSY
ncbi:MAG: single-stranded-DNA-specific exonuclease RecJ [Endomicrobia bacterium]|nr:single-stranded-DNA-specific exonuclease RecJ [Endomicrobiia bacterium]MCL2798713.1 single-stranded-DNA-specific exonuclease RecJ [Endomicrobiia bacterium]